MTSAAKTERRGHGLVAASSRRSAAFAVIAFCLLTIWSTWPVIQSAATSLPGGRSTESGTVPLFNLWTIWWNADRALHGLRDYWRAPIFHPDRAAFAFSEPQPATLTVAPILWLTGSRALAYNIYLFGSLLLNGVFARRLLRAMGVSQGLALAGGAAMLLLPIVHWQIDVLQLVPLWGILCTWESALSASRNPSASRGALLGLAFGVSFLLCGHHGLFLGMLLPTAAWVLPRNWWKMELWFGAASALIVAAAIILPVALPMRSSLALHRFVRDEDSIFRLSSFPGDYTAAVGTPLVDPGLLAARAEWRLSPGLVVSLLALGGIVAGLSRKRWRRWTIFLTITGLLAIVLSMGPNLRFGTYRPWWTLTSFIPGLAQVRNVFRFAYFMQMATVLLGFQGLHLVWLRLRLKHRSFPVVGKGLLTALALLAIFENRPIAPPLYAVPDYKWNQGWIEFVRKEVSGTQAILCLPFEEANYVQNFEPTARWMCLQSWHHAPMVNGYSGFFPDAYFELRKVVQREWGADSTWKRLSEAGVELIVVDRQALETLNFKAKFAGGAGLTLVFADDRAGFDVYRLPVGSDPTK